MNFLQDSITSLNAQLKNHELTPTRLYGQTIETIEEIDPEVNAFITLNKDAIIDDNLDFSDKLAGIPIAIKDNIITQNLLTTAASKILSNFVPIYQSTVVQKLIDHKMTIVGKTNLDEFAMGASNETSFYGPVKNPWDFTRVPGGSSGGSAAAVASGEVVVSLGSDTGGSIRQPAAFTGIFGIKPTYGRVSRFGLIAFASSLDQIGVLSKRVEDSALVLAVISGHDDQDATTSNQPVPDFTQFLNQDIKGLRVAVPKEYMGEGVNEDVKKIIQENIDLLEQNGAIINSVDLPYTKYVVPTYYIIGASEASSNLQRFDGIRYGFRAPDVKTLDDVFVKTRSIGFGDEVKRRIMLGTFALSAGSYDAYFKKAAQVRTLINEDFKKIFEENDVVVGPTSPTTAFKIGAEDKDPLTMYANDILTISANMTGIPAASVPAGLVDNLPVGFQIMANYFDEGNIFKVASFIENHNKFYEKTPAEMED